MVEGQDRSYIFNELDDNIVLPDISEIIQDRQGYYWISTTDGLWRFDGLRFKVFKNSFGPSSGVFSNNILTAYEDRQGRIWISTLGGGVSVSSPEKNSFHPLQDSLLLSSFRVNRIAQDSSGLFWFGGSEGLFILKEKSNGEFEQVKHQNANDLEILNSQAYLYDIHVQNDTIWIASNKGLYSFSTASNVYKKHSLASNSNRSVTDIATDRNNQIWVAVNNMTNPLFYYDARQDTFLNTSKVTLLSVASPINFVFDSSNVVWVSKFGLGVNAFEMETGKHILNSLKNSNIAYIKYVRDPYVDYSGNILFPSDGVKVIHFDRGFQNEIHDFSFSQSCSSVLNSSAWFIRTYREGGLVFNHKSKLNLEHHLQSEKVFDPTTSMTMLGENELMLCGIGGVKIINLKTQDIQSFNISGSNRYIFRDSQNRIWLSGQKNLMLFDKRRGVVKKFPLINNPNNNSLFLQTIVEDQKGNLWVASDGNGLFCFNPENLDVKQYKPLSDSNSIPSWRVNDIYFDNENQLWIATDQGLAFKSNSSDTLRVFGKNHGVHNEFIASVTGINDGLIWVSTNSGVSHFDLDSEQFENYRMSDGLCNSFYYPRVRYAHNDTIFFGGRNGIDFFVPKAIKKSLAKPTIELKEVRVENEELILNKTNPLIDLNYKTKYINISFTALNFPSPLDVQYMYRIIGITDNWIDLGTKGEVLVSKLLPGKYTFEVRAIDSGVNDYAATSLLNINVKSPFWKHPLFVIISFFLVSGLIGLYIMYLKNQWKDRAESKIRIQQKLFNLEKKALLSQMNPHFIFNSLNSIQEFILTGDKREAMKYLSKFSRLVRRALQFSNREHITLQSEIEFIEDYLELELLRFQDEFEYEINIQPNLDIHTLEILPFLIQPQIENSIRHGFANKNTKGKIEIYISQENETLEVKVKDNGVGRKKAMKNNNSNDKESLGLSIVKQRQ